MGLVLEMMPAAQFAPSLFFDEERLKPVVGGHVGRGDSGAGLVAVEEPRSASSAALSHTPAWISSCNHKCRSGEAPPAPLIDRGLAMGTMNPWLSR